MADEEKTPLLQKDATPQTPKPPKTPKTSWRESARQCLVCVLNPCGFRFDFSTSPGNILLVLPLFLVVLDLVRDEKIAEWVGFDLECVPAEPVKFDDGVAHFPSGLGFGLKFIQRLVSCLLLLVGGTKGVNELVTQGTQQGLSRRFGFYVVPAFFAVMFYGQGMIEGFHRLEAKMVPDCNAGYYIVSCLIDGLLGLLECLLILALTVVLSTYEPPGGGLPFANHPYAASLALYVAAWLVMSVSGPVLNSSAYAPDQKTGMTMIAAFHSSRSCRPQGRQGHGLLRRDDADAYRLGVSHAAAPGAVVQAQASR